MEGAWTDRAIREPITNAEVPSGFSCCASNPNNVVVHATSVVQGATEPLCRWKKGAAGKHFKGAVLTAATVEEAANQFSGKFCVNCKPLLKASLGLQVERFYS